MRTIIRFAKTFFSFKKRTAPTVKLTIVRSEGRKS